MTSSIGTDAAQQIAAIRALLDRGPIPTPTVDIPPRRPHRRWFTSNSAAPQTPEGPIPWPSC